MADIDWLEHADALLAAARRLEPTIAGEDAAIARATHTFGQDLFERIRAAGFSRVEAGLCHAPVQGFAAADPGAAAARTGVPLVFRAIR